MRLLKKALCVLLAIQTVFLLAACSPSEVEYSANGMTITMEDIFEKKDHGYYGMTYYDSEQVQVYVAKEEYSVLKEKGEEIDMDLEEYADFLLKSISATAEIKTEDGLTYFEYSKTPESVQYCYFVTVHKTADAFWYFTFACEASLIKEYRPRFEKWARSIVFDV